MLTPAQCRAARGLLNWTQKDLARHAEVGRITVRNFEAGETNPHKATLRQLRTAFEREGVDFVDEDDRVGVVVNKQNVGWAERERGPSLP